jgi:hypothetical protein
MPSPDLFVREARQQDQKHESKQCASDFGNPLSEPCHADPESDLKP